jgi:VIT1/CCC1 family predicted Fe2+/Mn2+ transporter
MASRMRPFQRIMEPADRIAEVMFGLIMALTFTGSISISDAGRNDVRAMLIGALGCNIAWGLIDGIFYVMIGFADRGRDARALQAVRNADDPAHAKALLAQTLPDEVAAVLTGEQLERVRITLAQAPPPIPPTPGVRDLLAGLAVASLVFGSTLPIALPFLLFQDGQLAMRVSNGIAIAMLFVAGALYARVVGGRAWLIGAVMVVLGIALVAMTIALGG